LGLETLRGWRCFLFVQSPDEHPAPKGFAPKSRRQVVAAFLTACAAIVVAFVLLRPARSTPFVVLHGPFHFPMSFRDWVDRCIPPKVSWRWAWKMEGRAFGARKPMLIQANVVSFEGSPPTLLSNSTLGPPNFSDANGLCVWLLNSNQVSALRECFKQTPGAQTLQRPRISTAEGIEASLFVGSTLPTLPAGSPPKQVGLELSCCGRFRGNFCDFLTHITFSELVTKDNPAIDTDGYGPNGYTPPTINVLQTNLDAALRLQLPKGTGFFLLDQSHHEPPRKNIGVLIDPL
jgi:hypothetical protein